MNLPNVLIILCYTAWWETWMALIDVTPCVSYVFHHFLKSGERKLFKLFMSIFKHSWKKKRVSKAVWKLISMFAYALFIPPCTPFSFKATESKVEPQLNSNGAAIKYTNTESHCDYGDVYASQISLYHCETWQPSISECYLLLCKT